MVIHITPVYTYVKEMTREERRLLTKLLAVRMKGYEYTHAYKAGHWDGYHHFFHVESRSFLTGFLGLISSFFQKNKLSIVVQNRPPATPLEAQWEDIITIPSRTGLRLRPYQQDAIRCMLQRTLLLHHKKYPFSRGIIKIPTGGGKTGLAAKFIQAAGGLRTLYLVERRHNLYQTQRQFCDWINIACGIIGDGIFDPQQITIATIQSLRSRLASLQSFFDSIEILMIDEAHRDADNDYHKIAVRCHNAWIRYGITATPLMRDDIGDCYLVGDTGDIVVDVPREHLEAQGYLAKACVLYRKIEEPKLQKLSFAQAYKYGIIHNDYRNARIVKDIHIFHKYGFIILVLVTQINHGKLLCEMLNESGIQSYFLSGRDPVHYRQELLEAIGRHYRVLIASRIFDESIDQPLLNCLIMAGGGKARSRTIQRVGRILRPKNDGRNVVYVMDYVDCINRYLFAHAKMRLETYMQEGFALKCVGLKSATCG